MNTPLVLADGFPRSDIDVLQVRRTRTQIIRVKNDLKEVMNDIQKELVKHHSQQRDLNKKIDSLNADTKDLAILSANSTSTDLPVFATVNSVEPNSPASEAVSCCSCYWFVLFATDYCQMLTYFTGFT